MYNFLVKNGQSLAFLIGTGITVLFLLFVLGGMEEFSTLAPENQAETSIFNFGLGSAIALGVIAFVAWILFSLFQTVTNIKGSLKGIIGAVALIAVFFIAYSAATVETSGPVYDAMIKQSVTEADSKFISGGIVTALVLAGLAAVSFIVLEVVNFFK